MSVSLNVRSAPLILAFLLSTAIDCFSIRPNETTLEVYGSGERDDATTDSMGGLTNPTGTPTLASSTSTTPSSDSTYILVNVFGILGSILIVCFLFVCYYHCTGPRNSSNCFSRQNDVYRCEDEDPIIQDDDDVDNEESTSEASAGLADAGLSGAGTGTSSSNSEVETNREAIEDSTSGENS